MKKRNKLGRGALTSLLSVICVIYVLPIIMVVFNSFKENSAVKTETFMPPTAETFVGWDNFITGITLGGSFWESLFFSLFITVVSAAMKEALGLETFFEKYPERAFDIGICEENAAVL